MNNNCTMYTALPPGEDRTDDELLKDINENVVNYVNMITGNNILAPVNRGTVEGFDVQLWKEGSRFAIAEFRIVSMAEMREIIANNEPAHEHLKETADGTHH